MKSSMKLKLATLGMALGLGLANTSVVANDCAYIAMQQTTTYCASVGGGSACGSVHSGVYRYYYDLCMRG